MDKITTINDKIEKLRKQRAKIQTQEAVLFRYEAGKIFGNNFSPEIALTVLSEWSTATESKKKEWTNKSNSFRTDSLQKARTKVETQNSADL